LRRQCRPGIMPREEATVTTDFSNVYDDAAPAAEDVLCTAEAHGVAYGRAGLTPGPGSQAVGGSGRGARVGE
jgi:hypothetical protein